ncbi:MAG: Sec-independent protein translocase protein TatB [Pseudomonadota bacterium]|nr:Sec-independent protein translocase protein TatB [Pseudomonadota bacterium]
MLDIGGWEFLLIVILGVIILGPKELPGAIRNVKLFLRRARELTGEFQSGLDEVARQADLDKVTENLKSAVSSVDDVRAEVIENLDPESEMRDPMDFEGEHEGADFENHDNLEYSDNNSILSTSDHSAEPNNETRPKSGRSQKSEPSE